MPEWLFRIEWPDGEITPCYSPSTVVREYLPEGSAMTISELAVRSAEALDRASDRVKARYGFRCSSAAGQLEEILSRARRFQGGQQVRILAMDKRGSV